jgi:thioredoxin 2
MAAMQTHTRGVIVECTACGQRNRLAYERLGPRPVCAKCQANLDSPAEPIDVTDVSEFEALTRRSALPVLVDFWAPWCGPCKMLAPELAKIAKDGSGRWIVVKVNTEEHPVLAQAHRVTAIPLMVLYKGGGEIARQTGALPAQGIRAFLQQHV